MKAKRGDRLFPGLELQRSEPIARQVYRKLRQSIISRRLPTGERLREVDIARTLGVSRTPVREAIARLVSDRLVRLLPGGGVEIIDTSRELEGIYHVRKALEGYAARLAAERATAEELRTLEALVEESRRLRFESFDERVLVNEQFHGTISSAARVPRLTEMIQEYREYATNEKTLRLYDRTNSNRALEDHEEILRCLREGNADAAERAMRAHLDTAYRNTVSARTREENVPTGIEGGQP